MRRPVQRSPAIEQAVLQAVADGATWRDLDARDDLPSARTVRNWVEEGGSFAQAFGFAKRVKAAGLAAEGFRRLDTLDLSKLDPKLASAAVNLAAKQADYLRWLATVTDPQEYGDRVRHEVAEGTVAIALFAGLSRPAHGAEVVGPGAARPALPESAGEA